MLLALNPGEYALTPGSLTIAQYYGAWENLSHTKRLWPFLPFDPRNKDRGAWWKRALRPLIEDERIPVARLARAFFAVQYFPYWSKRYGGVRVPSQDYGFSLVHQALARDSLVVLMFGDAKWLEAVPELRTYPRLYQLRSTQTATISPKNCPDGYREIVQRATNVT